MVEDEVRMASVIRRSLVTVGMVADVAARGEDAVSMATVVDYDAIVLDVMLPGISGFETCRMLRDRHVWSPVLMLTARDAVRDRVEGLDSGADDYLVKPFALAELHARLRSLYRRGRPERPAVLEFGDLRLDPARRRGEPRRRPDRPLREGVRAAGDADAPPGRGDLADRAARARVGPRLRGAIERRRRVHPPVAREGRPSVRARDDRNGPRGRLPVAGPRVSRLPIRVRLAAAFAVAMALVLTATGMLLYARLGNDLSAALDTDLRLRAQDLGQVVREPGGSLAAESNRRLIERGESFAQLLDARARVLDGTTPPGNVPLLARPSYTRRCGDRCSSTAPRCPASTKAPGCSRPASLTMLERLCSSSALPARTAPRRCAA